LVRFIPKPKPSTVLIPQITIEAPSLPAAARAHDEAMKELAGKSSLQAVVDAALAACAAHHASAKGLCT
jgi:hypothetical protein